MRFPLGTNYYCSYYSSFTYTTGCCILKFDWSESVDYITITATFFSITADLAVVKIGYGLYYIHYGEYTVMWKTIGTPHGNCWPF